MRPRGRQRVRPELGDTNKEVDTSVNGKCFDIGHDTQAKVIAKSSLEKFVKPETVDDVRFSIRRDLNVHEPRPLSRFLASSQLETVASPLASL